MKGLSYTLIAVAVLLIGLPLPAYLYFVMPFAAATNDPDAVEAPAWFLGVFFMFVGTVLIPFALGVFLHASRFPKNGGIDLSIK
jgi:hypothetical protein